MSVCGGGGASDGRKKQTDRNAKKAVAKDRGRAVREAGETCWARTGAVADVKRTWGLFRPTLSMKTNQMSRTQYRAGGEEGGERGAESAR